MFGVKTSFAYIIKINKIICIKSVHGVLLWLSEESWEIFVGWERDGGEEDDLPDTGRHSWNRMLCFFRLLNPWIFVVSRQTWAIKIPGNPLRGVRWLWQLLWVESDDWWFSQSSPGFYWSVQRNPSDWLWIFITHHFPSVSASPVSPWCDSILLESVACTGTALIYSARWASGTGAWCAAC